MPINLQLGSSQKIAISRWQSLVFPDKWLMLVWLLLMVIGIIMVTSASMSEADEMKKTIYFYTYRQAAFYGIGILAAYICYSIPTIVFMRNSKRLLFLSLLMLIAIYIPAVGLSINGARRWINLRLFHLQVGEIVKLSMILYAAAFLQRHSQLLARSWKPILNLLFVTAIFSFVLLMQPDFGTTMVMVATIFGMMFIAGVSLWRFMVISFSAFILMAGVLVSANYRVVRLLTFLNPWAYQYKEGYQLVNSLIAIGNGSLFGAGLGQSVQKHNYLPEAHTDFIFAIICEELGLVGALIVMTLFAILVWRSFVIGQIADRVRRRFSALVAYGIGLLLAIQALVNIGVTTGSLPTKGLTLPLISYGGSSVVMVCIALGILARIDSESRFQAEREGLLL